MAKQSTSLLPPVSQLQKLDTATAGLVIEAITADRQRDHSYAILGMVCGTVSFLGCVGSFTFLVLNGHPEAAGIILGTGVLAIVGRMIAARL